LTITVLSWEVSSSLSLATTLPPPHTLIKPGRNWKVHTFTSPMRTNTEKLYMLSIDAARCAGFRDSLYFFRRNPLIHKLSCSQPEKDRLIELGKLSGNLKSRAVTMVSARNVFKVMGATFVAGKPHFPFIALNSMEADPVRYVDGKYILDDYCKSPRFAQFFVHLPFTHASLFKQTKANL